MRRRPIVPHRIGNDRGFALVLVLWIAGILAVMASSLSDSVRTEVRVAANLVEAAKAEALADGGAVLAIRDLIAAYGRPSHIRRFPSDGKPIRCLIPGEGVLSIAVTDEAAKVDVNSAGLPLLQALLTGLGETPDKAARLAQAIFDFRDADDDRQPQGAESPEYRAAGLDWMPKNGRLQSLAELGQVHGMTPEHLARLRPHLGLHSGLAGIDASLASPELIALLRAGMAGPQAVAGGGFAAFHDDVALPAMFVSASRMTVFQLRVEARTATGAVFSREAVISLGSAQAPHPVPLRWARGDLSHSEERAGRSADAPAC